MKYKVFKKTVSIVTETPVQLFERLGKEKTGFLMESNDREEGRFTFFGNEPAAYIHAEGDSLVIEFKNGKKEVLPGNPKEELKKFCARYDVVTENSEPPFNGGLVGSFGYDFIRYSEVIPDDNPDEIGIDAIQLMLVTECLAVDHRAETLTAIVLYEDGNTESLNLAKEKAAALIEKVMSANDAGDDKANASGEEKTESEAEEFTVTKIKESDSLEQYSKKIEKIKHYIKEGHIFQTVLSQRWTFETGESGFSLYKRLRVLNPSPYLYYFNFPGFEVIGSSPEMLVKKTDNRMFTCPIAGTRPRGKDAAEDARLEAELLADEKERAEHAMLVDLARNDMGRVSLTSSVKLKEFMVVKKYSHVMHIVSLVEGKSKAEVHPVDLIASFLPAGTLSGAPKIRAMEIIDELESVKRGLYGGATGYLDFGGNLDFCITIRTMVKKGNRVYLQAGAGIVNDSNPESEYQECCNKVQALAKTLEKKEDKNL